MSHSARHRPDWAVDGCPDLGIPSCLTCPLPACRYELPPGRARSLANGAEVVRRLAAGETMAEIARAAGWNRRTVYRYLEVMRNAQAPA